MIVKLLGFADILAIVALLASKILPQPLVIAMAMYLVIKGIFFMITEGITFINFFDLLGGIYLIAASFGISYWILTAIVLIVIGQKAIVSLL